MKKPAILLTACLQAGSAMGAPGMGLAEMPPALQALVTKHVADGKLLGIERAADETEISYEVYAVSKEGQERNFAVAEDGEVSVEVTLAQTPVQVQKAIGAQLGAGKLGSIEREEQADGVSYDVEMVTMDRRPRSFTVDADGSLSDMEVDFTELSPAAQKAVTAHLGTGTLDSIDKMFDDKDVSYEVEMTGKDGRPWGFTIADNGPLLSARVNLADLSPGAQKTIKDKIGGGKILRIDQAFVEKKKKALPFEVEGAKDGAPCDFSVAGGGKFLGWD